MNNVNIKLIDKDLAKLLIESNHYSHKIPQAIKYRFGLYIKDKLKGVAIFSVPANMYTFTSMFEGESQHIGVELSRFFTYDDTPKNFESYCLSQCFKYIKNNSQYDLIVSYADPNFGHIGYLYQSLNADYTGKTNSEIRYLIDGQLITRRGLGRKKGDSEKDHVERLIASGAEKVKMEGKHKYLFFICNRRRKKQLLSKLKPNVEFSKDYPKLG
jgi:hypothetical protein